MEETVAELVSAGIAVELLVGLDSTNVQRYGVRLRTFGKSLPKNRMIIAAGSTFGEALLEATSKAEQRRWENLVWSARPWDSAPKQSGSILWGLDHASGAYTAAGQQYGSTNGYDR